MNHKIFLMICNHDNGDTTVAPYTARSFEDALIRIMDDLTSWIEVPMPESDAPLLERFTEWIDEISEQEEGVISVHELTLTDPQPVLVYVKGGMVQSVRTGGPFPLQVILVDDDLEERSDEQRALDKKLMEETADWDEACP